MEANKILQSDLLDIIFENRNKNYGAYALRKEYDSRLYKSLGLMLAALLLLCFIAGKSFSHEKIKVNPVIETVLYKMTNPPKTTPKPPVQKAPRPVASKSNTQVFVSNMKIVDSNQTATKLIKNLDSAQIASVSQTGTTGGKPRVNCVDCNTDSTSVQTPPVKGPDIHTPMLTAEVMPSFPGGMEALKRFLERNLTNPVTLNEGEMVSVKVQFVVGFDGKLKGFTVIEDGGDDFNHEVIRVLKKMPDWIPGKSRGENVSVYYTIPVKFISSEQ